MSNVIKKIIFILCLIGILIIWVFSLLHFKKKDDEEKEVRIKTEIIENIKDSLAKAIVTKDSNIVKLTIKYNDEKEKAIQLTDSAAIELFKQLCNE